MLSTLATVLLVPYFGWGIYALRLRYRFHEELSLVTEACTLLALVLFYALEASLLREALDSNRMQLVLASLGLLASGAALYGPMAISFSSRLIVEAVVPGPNVNDHRPRLGPAEALEKRKDYEGALQEYYVITRMFPRDHVVPMRIAQLQIELGRPGEAIQWLHRAQKWAKLEPQALTVVHRLIDLYEIQLKRPADARAVLSEFLNVFPACAEGPALRARLESIGVARKGPDSAALNALVEAPLIDEAEPLPVARSSKKSADKPSAMGLTALDDAPVMAERFDKHVVEARPAGASAATFSLEKLDDAGPIEYHDAPRTTKAAGLTSLSLDSLDLEPLSPAEGDAKESTGKKKT